MFKLKHPTQLHYLVVVRVQKSKNTVVLVGKRVLSVENRKRFLLQIKCLSPLSEAGRLSWWDWASVSWHLLAGFAEPGWNLSVFGPKTQKKLIILFTANLAWFTSRSLWLTCSWAMREVFCSLMMVLLNALCISSICLRYLNNKNVKITITHMVHLIKQYYTSNYNTNMKRKKFHLITYIHHLPSLSKTLNKSYGLDILLGTTGNHSLNTSKYNIFNPEGDMWVPTFEAMSLDNIPSIFGQSISSIGKVLWFPLGQSRLAGAMQPWNRKTGAHGVRKFVHFVVGVIINLTVEKKMSTLELKRTNKEVRGPGRTDKKWKRPATHWWRQSKHFCFYTCLKWD